MTAKTETKEPQILLRLVSLLLALVMWINFSGRVDVSNSTEKVFLNIPLIFKDKPDHIGLQNNQNFMVHVTLSGPERDMHKVTAADIQASLSLAGRGRGEHTFPLDAQNITLPNRLKDFLVVSVIPDRLNLTLEHITRKKLKLYIDVRGQPATDFEYIGEVLTPSDVTIEGPSERIKDLTMLVSKPIVIEGATADVNGTFELARELPRGAFLLENLGQLHYQIMVREKHLTVNRPNAYPLIIEVPPGEERLWRGWQARDKKVLLNYSGPNSIVRWFRPEWVAPKLLISSSSVLNPAGKPITPDTTKAGKVSITQEWLLPEAEKNRTPDWQDRLKKIDFKWRPAQMEVTGP